MKKRILVVDDNKAILDVLTETLIYENFDVLNIALGVQLFDAVQSFKPDLILLDYKLADTNGGDLCKQLKASAMFRHIPVIIFSAYFTTHDDVVPLGCDGILYKPFDMDSLLKLVGKFLRTVPGGVGDSIGRDNVITNVN